MNANITKALSAKIQETFAAALNEVIGTVGEMLDEATASNENNENQVSSAQMTITPKILIQFTTPGEFHIEVRVPAKRIVTSTGEAEQDLSVDENGEEIDDGQQELPGIEDPSDSEE